MATAKKTSTAAAAKTPARRTPAKPVAKTSSKAVSKTAVVPVAAKPAKPAKSDKARKPKLVRDSFTIPKSEYGVLATLKQRAALSGNVAKKSEVLRAGIMALAAMSDAAFIAAIGAVPTIKTGRPAKA